MTTKKIILDGCRMEVDWDMNSLNNSVPIRVIHKDKVVFRTTDEKTEMLRADEGLFGEVMRYVYAPPLPIRRRR